MLFAEQNNKPQDIFFEDICPIHHQSICHQLLVEKNKGLKTCQVILENSKRYGNYQGNAAENFVSY